MRIRFRTTLVAPLAIMACLTLATADPAEKKAPDTRGSKAVAAKSTTPGLKKFHVTAFDGNIAPSVLRVKKGDRVEITFVSKDAKYGIKFKDFDISAKVSADQPAVVEIVTTQAGSFEFRCSKFWGVKHTTNGTLIVE